jgi:arylsulfatase
VIFFLSDNGASAEIMVRGEGHDPGAPMGSAKTYLCLGPGFSSAANTPFRRHKTWVHEGGVSTPFIAHWPKGIAARNRLRSTAAHVIDIAPTVLELAGAKATADAGAPPIPGHSLVPVFNGDTGDLHEVLWFYHEGNRALRQGDWKIVHTVGPRNPWRSVAAAEDARPGDWALYNLSTDRGEQNDLAAKHPDRVRSMASIWKRWNDQFILDAGEPPSARGTQN